MDTRGWIRGDGYELRVMGKGMAMSVSWDLLEGGSAPPLMKFAGEIDTAAAGEFVEAVRVVARGSDGGVDVDLDLVHFMDSAGVRALVVLRRELGDQLRIVSVSPTVRRLFEMCGIEHEIAETDATRDVHTRR
jgi:anti-anti-sigma factor